MEPGEPAAAPADDDVAQGAIDRAIVDQVRLAFAPIHKMAFGIAIGVATGLLITAITFFHVVLDPQSASPLRLLDQYFYGYDVSLRGVLVGGLWGFAVGFVGGWFVAFCRNLAIAISVFVTRTRAELSETRDFLDHI